MCMVEALEVVLIVYNICTEVERQAQHIDVRLTSGHSVERASQAVKRETHCRRTLENFPAEE